MNILVIGEKPNLEECKAKFGEDHSYMLHSGHHEIGAMLTNSDVAFDFIIHENPFQIEHYADKKGKSIFLNAAMISLVELSGLVNHSIQATVLGFNGLPTFMNRDLLEVSVLRKEDEPAVQQMCVKLNTKFQLVDDRVGMVSPRIVCMIINEAYFTVQEGTASRADIDKAMKLGTNYPYGPFEWCQRIGISHVVDVLEAVYEDTRDERYKICPLLKREYLNL